jgi:putative ABC transport system permease protein
MGVLWHKIFYDIWSNKARSLLVILSIAAGVFAIGAIYGMVDQLLTGMDRAHQAISPSHLNLILRSPIDQSMVDELKNIPGVAGIAPVNQLSVRYKTSPEGKWEIGTLMERPDYQDQLYDLVTLTEGAWPQDDRIGVERLTSRHEGINPGDQVIFRVGGEEQKFDISGILRHPFVQPPNFGGQAHFFTDAQGLARFGIPEGQFGQLLVRVEPYSPDRAQSVAGEIRSYLAEKGFGVVVTIYQDPDKHWGRMFVEGVTLIMQVMAVVSLILSVVIVLNTLMAVITLQTDQIGVIKAIGGQSGVVVRVFMVEVLIYGIIALLIALPTALVFSFEMTSGFLNLFNIDYQEFTYSTRSIIFMLLAALLAPALAALWPILKGAWISVREAIATYGLGGDFGNSWLDRAIERVGARFLSTPYAAALGNVFRRKARLGLTLLVLVIAGVMFLVVMSLTSSIQLTLDNEMARQDYDIRIGFSKNQSISEVQNLVAGVPGVDRTTMWLSRNATILREGEKIEDSAGLGAQLIGIPTADPMYRPMIAQGRWVEPGDQDVVVISEETAQKNGIAIGDSIILDLGELGASPWKIIGTYRVIYGSGYLVEPIYAPLSQVEKATGLADQGTQLLIRSNAIRDLPEETALADKLKTVLENAGISLDFYTTSARLEQRQYANNQFNTVVSMLINLAMLVGVVGGIGLMGSLSISVVERRREIGVLRAVGARSSAISSMFAVEGILQGLISFLIAAPLAYLLAQPLARLLGQTMISVNLDYTFNFPAVAIWFGSVLMISALASILPAYSATRISVRQSLAYA